MKRAVAYARFSSDMQREESIDAQLYDINKFATDNGYIILKEYRDEAVSGRTDAREGFQSMIKDANNNEFEYIIAHKIDRFARDKYDNALYKSRLRKKGIRVIFSQQRIEDTPEGHLMEGILESFADYYVRNQANEVMKGMKNNARNAQFNGGTPPLGFDVDDNKKYIINNKEAIIIKEIFELYLEGKGYKTIVSILNTKGYKNKLGRSFVFNSIKPILTNKKYMGTYEYNKTNRSYNESGRKNLKRYNKADEIIVIEDAIPPIISKVDFYEVNEIIKSRQRARRTPDRLYLLRGLLTCSKCGRKMSGYKQSKKSGYVRYYYRCTCQNSVPAEDIEKYVVSLLNTKIFNNIDELVSIIKEESQNTNTKLNKEIGTYEKSLKEVEKQQNNLISFIMEYGSNNKVKEQMKDLEKQEQILKSTISKNKLKVEFKKEDIINWLHKLKVDFQKEENQKQIINSLVDKIIVDDEIKVHINFI